MIKKKILIIDDEKDFTDMIKLNLEDTGKFQVFTEDKGMQALNTAKRCRPDLILLDVIIMDLDGGAIRHQLKNDPNTKNIPIIFLTATVDAAQVPQDDNVVGGYVFIAKPVSVSALVRSITKALENGS